jgi:hypothetical protein
MRTIETISPEDVIATPPADPRALDPLSPIAPRPPRFTGTVAPADPLALDPLDPVVA